MVHSLESRPCSGWGVPKEVLPTLRKVATMGRKTPQSIAEEFIRQLPDETYELIDQGSHAELLERCETYRRIFAHYEIALPASQSASKRET